MTLPRYRLAVDASLSTNARVTLQGAQAHYLSQVLRMGLGDAVALFNRTEGEWCARVSELRKRELVLTVEACVRKRLDDPFHLTVCFAPIKGGRLETVFEKATELGAQVLQPVLTTRTVVDRINLTRAEAIVREAAEQCGRLDWPEVREPVKLLSLLGNWPADVPLIYGDERGDSPAITPLTQQKITPRWAVLAGPEGGFAPEEFTALSTVSAARGVSLGPRILRADTAIITLCTLTLAAWGDWEKRPSFQSDADL